MFVFLFSIIHE